MLIAIGSSDTAPDHQFRRKPGFPAWTLGLRLQGTTITTPEGSPPIRNGPGQVTLARPRLPYQLRNGPGRRWRGIWVIFDPPQRWLHLLEWPESAPGYLRLTLPPGEIRHETERALLEAQHHLRQALGQGRALAENAFERFLLWANRANPHSGEARLDPRLRRMLDHIGVHYREALSVADLAHVAGLSPSRLSHLCQEQLHDPPMRLVERHRIERARELLLGTGERIAAIAAAVGFENPYHFSTRFRHVTGWSPRALRLRHGA